MRLSNVNKLDFRALAGGGGLLLLVMFLPWFGTAPEDNPYVPPARNVSVSAWEGLSWIDLFLALTALAALGLAYVVYQRGSEKATRAELTPVFVLASASTTLILYRLIEPIENTVPKWGAFVGLLVAGFLIAASLDGGRYIRARFDEWLADLNRLQGPEGARRTRPGSTPAEPAQPASPPPERPATRPDG